MGRVEFRDVVLTIYALLVSASLWYRVIVGIPVEYSWFFLGAAGIFILPIILGVADWWDRQNIF